MIKATFVGLGCATLLTGACIVIAACDDDSSSPSQTPSSSGNVNPDSGSPGSSSGNPASITLAAADKQDVTPCPSQDDLKTEAPFATLKTALTTGTISYLDVPFVDPSTDPDILKKKCGLEGFWDPTKSVNPVPVTGVPNLLKILQTGNAGICAQGFANFGTDEGFPVAGTYRKEFKAASGGATYHLRARITASGSAAGKKFSEIPLTVAEVKSKLTYQVNGTTAAHDDLWTALINAMKAPVPSATLDAQNGGATIFSSKIELICVAKQ